MISSVSIFLLEIFYIIKLQVITTVPSQTHSLHKSPAVILWAHSTWTRITSHEWLLMVGGWGAGVHPPELPPLPYSPPPATATPRTHDQQSIPQGDDGFCHSRHRRVLEKALPGRCRGTRGPAASCSRASRGSSCAGWAAPGRVCPRPLPAAPRSAHAPSGLGQTARSPAEMQPERRRERNKERQIL